MYYIAIIALLIWVLTSNWIFLIAGIILLLCCANFSQIYRGGGGEHTHYTDMGKPWSDKLSLVDPRFNLREAAKQIILLEDHMFHENKHCLDCISKHDLFTEGLLEEAITMDPTGKYTPIAKEALQGVKFLVPALIEKMKNKTATPADFKETADALRKIRKPLATEYSYFDI